MSDAVTCAIPGAKTVAQARENISAADLPSLSADVMARLHESTTSRSSRSCMRIGSAVGPTSSSLRTDAGRCSSPGRASSTDSRR